MNRRKRRVEKLMEREFWDGFFGRMGDGLGPSRGLEFTQAPQWYNDVADVAYAAGWTYADEAIKRLGTRRFGIGLERKIPARVVADCYAAGRVA